VIGTTKVSPGGLVPLDNADETPGRFPEYPSPTDAFRRCGINHNRLIGPLVCGSILATRGDLTDDAAEEPQPFPPGESDDQDLLSQTHGILGRE
jgi:hypothetical protein